MSKNQELAEILKKIKYKYNLTQSEIAREIGVSKQYLSDTLNERYPFNNELRQKLFERFTCLSTDKSEAVPFTPHARAGIPLVSQYAYAGYLGGYGDPEYVGTLPTIDFTPDREMTGNWLAFEVKGDSMDDGTKDSYVEGEIVICREVEPDYWRDSRLFINKRDFVIVHEEGILIKRITEHDVEAHTITIHSLNPMYPDRILHLEQVRQIFSIVESRIQRRR